MSLSRFLIPVLIDVDSFNPFVFGLFLYGMQPSNMTV